MYGSGNAGPPHNFSRGVLGLNIGVGLCVWMLDLKLSCVKFIRFHTVTHDILPKSSCNMLLQLSWV
jgi:hypothetical protein